jgi:hypothetical protein
LKNCKHWLARLSSRPNQCFFTFKEIQLQPSDPVRHLNQRQLADRWDLSEATLERWRSEGIGPIFLKLQGQVRYRIEDIESFEADSLRKSTSEREVAGGAV